MAGSLEQRIGNLEKLYSTATRADGPEGWMETMAASLRLAEQKATDEEAQGNVRRRLALDNLYKFMERSPNGVEMWSP